MVLVWYCALAKNVYWSNKIAMMILFIFYTSVLILQSGALNLFRFQNDKTFSLPGFHPASL